MIYDIFELLKSHQMVSCITIVPSNHCTLVPSNHCTLVPSNHCTILPSNHCTLLPSNHCTPVLANTVPLFLNKCCTLSVLYYSLLHLSLIFLKWIVLHLLMYPSFPQHCHLLNLLRKPARPVEIVKLKKQVL